jgi:hypothetical protein
MALAQAISAAFHRPIIPAAFFFGGVAFDTVTLTRIDRLSDNLILLADLSLLGILIVLTGRADRGSNTTETVPLPVVAGWVARARPYYPMAVQFLLGSLFSAYAVFYFHSASFAGTAVFFALLVGLLVGNEFLHDRASSLKLMLALYALAASSFLTFFLPVITGRMTTAMFLIGAALSAAFVVAIVGLVYRGPIYSRREPILTMLPALLVVGSLVAFYFLNWIPPVPLSMSFGGVYHKVARSGDAYELTFERAPLYRFWKRSDDPFRGQEGAHCFTAIFAPVDLRAEIYHRWQYRQPEGRDAGRCVTTDRIPLTIVGGRADGYRAFTVKQQVVPGDWRVDVETADGRLIGRVSFRVEASTEPLAFETIFY